MKLQQTLSRIVSTSLTLLVVGATTLTPTAHIAKAASSEMALQQSVYIVQRGDTLSAIARRYDTTVQALIQFNSLPSTNIYVGQRLFVPGGPVEPLPAPLITYVVQRGDTLSKIARSYGVTVNQIKSLNGLVSDTIRIGQSLLIQSNIGTVPNSSIERIKFAPGAYAAAVTGRSTYGAPKKFALEARRGQTMKVSLITPPAYDHLSYITILDANGYNLIGADGPIHYGEVILPASGNYIVEVWMQGNARLDFTLTVEIR